MKTRGLLDHGSHRAVLLFGETDGLLQRRHVNFKAGDYMVNSHCGEHLGWPLSLISFDPYFVTGNFLVVLLAKNGHDIERGTSSQSGSDKFNRLRSGTSGCIVQQQVMAASGLGHKLAL